MLLDLLTVLLINPVGPSGLKRELRAEKMCVS